MQTRIGFMFPGDTPENIHARGILQYNSSAPLPQPGERVVLPDGKGSGEVVSRIFFYERDFVYVQLGVTPIV
jgi:hypothetical protein